jgi:integrase
MLTIRKRGRFYHVRGTVRVGREPRVVKEHSSGTDRRDDADAYRSKLETEIRREILHGRGGRTQSLTIADAGLRYMGRPGGLRSYDLWRLDQINKVVGDRSIAAAGEAWAEFRRVRCGGLDPATVQRFRSTFQAAINYLAGEEGFDPPRLPKRPRGERVDKKRVRFLTDDPANRLIASYAKHARPIAVTLRWQGFRIGEALRLEWPHVDWSRNSIFIAESKNGEPRTVSMHKQTRAALHRLWVVQGSPKIGFVFLAPIQLARDAGEADWIDWANVHWQRRSITIETKTGQSRTLILPSRTIAAMSRLWRSLGEPKKGRVYLDQLGAPYVDPRSYKFPSGSPIKKAHATACRKAGIVDFHVHDWRHHWACHCVMAGIDLETIKQEGGWKSLRMVERYATVSAAHRSLAMAKLGTAWASNAAIRKK